MPTEDTATSGANGHRIEIVNRFSEANPTGDLLYTPVDGDSTYRETRVYDLLFAEGSNAAEAEAFAIRVLADEHAQAVHLDAAPAIDGYRYYIDILLKSNVLDLEKNMIRKLEPKVKDLTIRRRIYVQGEAELPPERITRDLVNPVIQQAEIVPA